MNKIYRWFISQQNNKISIIFYCSTSSKITLTKAEAAKKLNTEPMLESQNSEIDLVFFCNLFVESESLSLFPYLEYF